MGKSFQHNRDPRSGGGGGGQNFMKDVNKFKGWKAARQVRKKSADLDRFHKIKALKKYANLCRQEGIESDRVNLGKKPRETDNSNNANDDSDNDSNDNDDTNDRNANRSSGNKKNRFAKPAKKDPFAASKLLAIKKQEEVQQKQLDEEKKKKEIERAERAREHLRKQHMKRTSKGQPLMNSKILGLLEKIKSKA
jgi:hypothetical protein